MNLRWRFIFSLSFILLVASSLWAQHATTDYDHKVDFSRYHTYSWAKVSTPNSIWDHRVQDAIYQELAAKGWTKVPTGGDVAVVAMGTSENKTRLETFYNDMGEWGWNSGFGTATTTQEEYQVGTLIVDMFEGQSKQLLWRSVATDTLAGDPNKDAKKLENAAKKMFKDFPPKPKE